MGLARAFRAAGNEDRAALELRSARGAFEQLGARLDALRAAREMGETRVARSPQPRETRVFMFTDIVKSTDLVRLIGDDAWGHLVRWHNDLIGALVAQHAGEVVRMTGDGFFVTFSDIEDALGCAVAIQQALREHRLTQGFSPLLRIGLHVTEATREGPDWSGVGVHAAARIGTLADSDEILLSRESAEAAGSAYTFSKPRRVTLKGLSEPLDVVAVEWH
jgi:class 3 adenylate cyclase